VGVETSEGGVGLAAERRILLSPSVSLSRNLLA
jgi:hypothetical protein